MTTVPSKAPSTSPIQPRPALKASVMVASPSTDGRVADANTGLTWLSPPDDTSVTSELWDQALGRPLAEFLSRPGKSIRANVVSCTWNLAFVRTKSVLDSAYREQASVPASLPFLIELIHAGSLIIDDIQDGSTHRRGVPALHERFGLPISLNAGNSLYFHALTMVERLGLPGERELALYRAVTRAMLSCHQGQALDLAVQISSLRQAQIGPLVRSISDRKTGGLMALATTVGPIAQGAPASLVEPLARFGASLGRGLQMLNDLADLTGRNQGEPDKRFEDLAQGRATWPWAWLAEETEGSSFRALQEQAKLASRSADPNARTVRALGVEMIERLGPAPERRATCHLARALDTLRGELGGDDDLSPLAAEIARLEAGYASGS